MSLLPIIYTSLLIFSGLVTTVLLVSYIIFKARGGAPKPAAVKAVQQVTYQQTRVRKTIAANSKNYSYQNNKPLKIQNSQMSYKRPVSINAIQPARKISNAPRIQIINKSTEKKIVVVKKSTDQNTFNDTNNFLGYYHDNEQGVLFQS